jgi:hypothetical protein
VKIKKFLFLLLAGLLSGSTYAQYAEDALRFSEQYYQGTARSMAVAGSFGALGGDVSVLSTNPAGLGLFRSNSYSITPEVFTRKTSSEYNGGIADDSRTIFDLSSFSLISSTFLGDKKNGLSYFQVGFGLNRTNNFNSESIINGYNYENSRLDAYLANADGVYYQDIEDDRYGMYSYDLTPAWNTYLIDTIPGYQDWYFTPVPWGGVYQTQRTRTYGSVNEWVISVAGNFSDKLYVGFTLGMPMLRYYSESTYSEYDSGDTIPYFESWSVYENLSTTGVGVNLKVGFIYRPVDWVRIGVAFHSPTWYGLHDYWYTIHNSDLEYFGRYSSSSPNGIFDYHLHTPYRVIADMAMIIRKQGFISVEYEFTDYSNAKFKAPGVDYDLGVNQDIKNYFGGTHNLRIGGEYRPGAFSLRAGYALYGTPYADNLNDGKKQYFTGGLGYTSGHFSIDAAFVYGKKKEDYYLYTSDYGSANPTLLTSKDYQAGLTLTFRK